MTMPKSMVLVPGGSFVMGSTDFRPEERPLRRADAADLWFDEHPVGGSADGGR
jgi:formylglycine-generating enzyme required for sulfatase activity